MTVNPEFTHHSPPSDIAKITDDMLDVAQHNQTPSDELYARLRTEKPRLLNWLIAHAISTEKHPDRAGAHVRGALSMYALLQAVNEAEQLEQLLLDTPPDIIDGDDDASQQL